MAREAKYTLDTLTEMIRKEKMENSGDLRRHNASAYAAASRNQWLSTLFPDTAAPAKPRKASKAATETAEKPAKRVVKKAGTPKREAGYTEVPGSVVVTLSGITTIKALNEARALAARNSLELNIQNEAA